MLTECNGWIAQKVVNGKKSIIGHAFSADKDSDVKVLSIKEFTVQLFDETVVFPGPLTLSTVLQKFENDDYIMALKRKKSPKTSNIYTAFILKHK